MKSVIAVYDAKAGCFGDPVFCETEPVAIRSFENAVREPTHPYHVNPEDFRLFKLGEYDPINGTFALSEVPTELAFAGAIFARSQDMNSQRASLHSV